MYSVDWLPSAALEFAGLWLSLNDSQQSAVLAALTVFKRQLTADPFSASESREPGIRIMIESPLSVTYRIERDGYTVSIVHVRMFQPPA